MRVKIEATTIVSLKLWFGMKLLMVADLMQGKSRLTYGLL